MLFRSVSLPGQTSVLNPLLPINRLIGLRPGQHWRLRLFDPLVDALAAALPGAKPELRFLDAQVLSEPQVITWLKKIRDAEEKRFSTQIKIEDDQEEVSCHVTEYREQGQVVGRTWSRASDGLVLRQETKLDGDQWTLERQTK